MPWALGMRPPSDQALWLIPSEQGEATLV
jgi:hypothetical protein